MPVSPLPLIHRGLRIRTLRFSVLFLSYSLSLCSGCLEARDPLNDGAENRLDLELLIADDAEVLIDRSIDQRVELLFDQEMRDQGVELLVDQEMRDQSVSAQDISINDLNILELDRALDMSHEDSPDLDHDQALPCLCDDDDPCNGAETCDPQTGECLSGEPIICDDGDICNGIESCDPRSGDCVSLPQPSCPASPDACDESGGVGSGVEDHITHIGEGHFR